MLPLLVTFLLYFMKLSILIDEDDFRYKMFPFHFTYKKIKRSDISSVVIKEYNTDKSFHGWGMGVRFWGHTTSYTISGYQGVEITLHNGNVVFIGSGKVDEIRAFLTHA